ncbi:MAG: right-handed parallel beta-helix repeat-containing protein [Candidatus Bathyarchaeia archaeon]
MKKVVWAAFFTAVLAGGFAFGGESFVVAQYGTNVSGIIGVDTTWTETNSPYTLTGNILVSNGITLTIEPGVTVNLNDYYIKVNGTLVARGTSTSRIYMTRTTTKTDPISGDIALRFTEYSSGWNPQTGTGSIIENAIINSSLYCEHASPMISQNTIRGIITSKAASSTINRNTINGEISLQGGSQVISRNTIVGDRTYNGISISEKNTAFVSGNTITGSFYGSAISIGDSSPIISDNTIAGSFIGVAIDIGGGSPTIQRNLISNDLISSSVFAWRGGIGVSVASTATIEQNTIAKNSIGILLAGDVSNSQKVTIVNNNIIESLNYSLKLSGPVSVDVTNNWWGTTDTGLIDRRIYDFNDNFEMGKVNYMPFLTEANPQAIPDPNASLPTPNTTQLSSPTSTPGPNSSTSPPPSLTATPSQSVPGNADLLGLSWGEIVAIALLSIIAVLLVIVIVFLRKSRRFA